MASTYEKKMIISGDIVEIYEYKNPILEGYDIKKYHECGRGFVANDEDKKINRSKSLNRASNRVRRLINANVGEHSKFITLTFKENITDLKSANYEFKKFKQRLEYEIGYKLQYLAVIEFQKRGAIHYHVIMFNCPYVKNKDLNSIWGNGYVKINKINHVDNVGAYITKYMTKDSNDNRLIGEKMWFSSKGLEEPREIKDKKNIENVQNSLYWFQTYCNTFSNDYNSITYTQYNINENSNQFKLRQAMSVNE